MWATHVFSRHIGFMRARVRMCVRERASRAVIVGTGCGAELCWNTS